MHAASIRSHAGCIRRLNAGCMHPYSLVGPRVKIPCCCERVSDAVVLSVDWPADQRWRLEPTGLDTAPSRRTAPPHTLVLSSFPDLRRRQRQRRHGLNNTHHAARFLWAWIRYNDHTSPTPPPLSRTLPAWWRMSVLTNAATMNLTHRGQNKVKMQWRYYVNSARRQTVSLRPPRASRPVVRVEVSSNFPEWCLLRRCTSSSATAERPRDESTILRGWVTLRLNF